MKIFIDDEKIRYDVENIYKIFSPVNPRMVLTDSVCNLYYKENSFEIFIRKGDTKAIRGYFNESYYEVQLPDVERNTVRKSFYKLLSGIFSYESPFGFLVGVRPVKIVHEMMDRGIEPGEAKRMLMEDYLIREDKANLLVSVAMRERKKAFPIDEKSVSLYIGIPFCKSRCYYCSFSGMTASSDKPIVAEYVDAICREIEGVMDYLGSKNVNVDLVYIGGGTPTAVKPEHLERIVEAVRSRTDMALVKEFTIEAGRPDTIDDEMLSVIYESGADRLCINPQTMCDKTLGKIGRTHSSGDIEALMKKLDRSRIKSVNMDLIAGLQDETLDDFIHTLEKVAELKPENITVHTLSVKRGSKLNEYFDDYGLSEENLVSSMVEESQRFMAKSGYVPYYLYRQKNIIANLENVGYALPGSECLYNIKIMAEKNTFLGLGSGAASKFYMGGNRFERFNNVKGVHDYIARVDEMIDRKIQMLKESNI